MLKAITCAHGIRPKTACQECHRERGRNWRRNHPEKAKEWFKKDYGKNPEKYKERCKRWMKKHPEKIKEYNFKHKDYRKKWEQKNKQRRKEQHRQYYLKNRDKEREKNHRNYLKNRERYLLVKKRWKLNNREYYLNHQREYDRKRYILYGEQLRKRGREYGRKHSLAQGTKVIYGLNKRDYPEDERCELCDNKREKNRRLVYHHWDDDNLNYGIWICNYRCHRIVEAMDKIGAIEFEQYVQKIIKYYEEFKCKK